MPVPWQFFLWSYWVRWHAHRYLHKGAGNGSTPELVQQGFTHCYIRNTRHSICDYNNTWNRQKLWSTIKDTECSSMVWKKEETKCLSHLLTGLKREDTQNQGTLFKHFDIKAAANSCSHKVFYTCHSGKSKLCWWIKPVRLSWGRNQMLKILGM